MTDSATVTALAYYAAHGAALFPIPAGQKNPTGIVGSFALDCSRDPAQWARWAQANPGCNWGVVAGPSGWIIVDIDVKGEGGREAAWATWCALCGEWGIEPAAPHVQSARGGWHVYFKTDATNLRQPDAIKKLINTRAGNGFTVAAGSYYDGTAKSEASGSYVLLSDAAPYPAPAALVAHCTRANRDKSATSKVGERDRDDVAGLVRWLAERDAFASYEDWVGVGMALKLEYGDDGLPLWQIAHDETVTADIEATKWESFATEPAPGVQTLNTWLDRAHKLGWRGSVRKSASSMFGTAGTVAAMAQASGATLASGAGPLPMMAGQAVLAELGQPILDDFLAAADADLNTPGRPSTVDFPTLPESVSGHGLFVPLRQCIERVIAMTEGGPKGFKSARAVDMLAVLSLVHQDTFDAVCRRIRSFGCTLPDGRIKLYAAALAEKVERVFVKQDDWIYSPKGEIEHDNSDNVAVFLGILGLEIRWNGWLERAEVRGGADPELRWSEWTYIDDTVVAKLRTRGNRTKTRFRPGRDFFWESLLALSQRVPHDPAIAFIDAAEAGWDRTARLSIWLTAACGVPCDPYHQAVGRNIIGGMVRRIRRPGCKHDTMAVFFGPQGTGKSTLARLLAGFDDWFTDAIMLGDASKELVLSLAGKSVVEIGEMGMRGAANPNHVKAMISRQVDSGRTAYARAVSERPRRNIFIGTTNDDEPLIDPTGNRRFLPVRVDGEINLQWLAENIAQLIGEAAALESAGQDFALPREVWGAAAERQEAARSESDVETQLHDWLGRTAITENAYIAAADLVTLAAVAGWRHGGTTAARGAAMKALGFRKENFDLDGKRSRVWVRGAEDMQPSEIRKSVARYRVSVDSHGLPRVSIEAPMSAPVPVLPGLAPPP